MNPSFLSRLWRRLHVRLAANQRRRTSDALAADPELRQHYASVIAEIQHQDEAERIADIIQAAQAVADGQAAARADRQKHATHLRAIRVTLDGMECIAGAN